MEDAEEDAGSLGEDGLVVIALGSTVWEGRLIDFCLRGMNTLFILVKNKD